MFQGIAHVAFTSSDMERTLDFYTRVCGLSPAFILNKPDGSPWIHYLKICPEQFVEFFYGGQVLPRPDSKRPVGYGHFCIETDDIAAKAKRLHQLGYAESPEPTKGLDGNASVMIRDPDGNLVEFVQYFPGSPLKRNGEPTPGSGIAHLAFYCKDVEQSLAFYQLMGFTKLWTLDHPETGEHWITYVRLRPGQIVELYHGQEWERPQPDPGFRPAGFTHTCIEVADIFEAVEYLRCNGVTIDREPVLGIELNYQAWVKDPDGNPIELMQMHPDSPQIISSRVDLVDVLFNANRPE